VRVAAGRFCASELGGLDGPGDVAVAEGVADSRSVDRGGVATLGVVVALAGASPAATDVFQLDPEIEPKQVERVRAVRASRSQTEWRAALDEVETSARGTANLVPPIIAAVEAHATLGEIADTMRKVFGEHQDVSPVAAAATRP